MFPPHGRLAGVEGAVEVDAHCGGEEVVVEFVCVGVVSIVVSTS